MKLSFKKSVYDFSIENDLPHVLKEYNGEKDIKEVGFDSTSKVSWVCERGHEVFESPHARLRRKGAFCPWCGKNRKGTIAQEDLEMALMYSDTNKTRVDQMPSDSSLMVDWKCPNGHTWQRTVVNQLRIRTCPICAKRVPSDTYSLFALHPELECEWDEQKNEGIDKDCIMPNANKKLWWNCHKGHSYQCTAADRHRGKGCPFCAGKKVIENDSLAATDSLLVQKYWNYDKNVHKPNELPRTSKRKVWISVGGKDIFIPINEFVEKYK